MNTASSHLHLFFFESLIGEHNVLTGIKAQPYLCDWRKRYVGSALAVLLPPSRDMIPAIIRYCAAYNIPIVAQGGNTGLVGGATPNKIGDSVVISTKKLNKIIEIDPYDNSMIVESGCTLEQIHQEAKRIQKQFPLRLASEGSCTIGGNIATNAGGTQVLRYGTMRDLISGVELITASGQSINTLEGLHKDNRGYNITHSIAGSEGTLGIITQARLKLFPISTDQSSAWIALKELGEVLQFFKLCQTYLYGVISCFELISYKALMTVFESFPQQAENIEPSAWYVLLELDSHIHSDLSTRLQALLERALTERIIANAYLAQNQTQAMRYRQWRELISEAQSKQGKNIKHDISLPIAKLEVFYTQLEQLLETHFPAIESLVFGHVGDGNLHYNLRFKNRIAHTEAELFSLEQQLNTLVYDTVLSHNGSISAEHGIGQLKAPILRQYLCDARYEWIQQIKKALDPNTLMNPGKIFTTE